MCGRSEFSVLAGHEAKKTWFRNGDFEQGSIDGKVALGEMEVMS